MKRFLTAAALALGLAGCGSHGLGQAGHDITPAQKAKAEAVAKACVNKGGGFKAMFHCAVPPHHGVQFVRCVIDHAPKPLSPATIQADLINCGEKYR